MRMSPSYAEELSQGVVYLHRTVAEEKKALIFVQPRLHLGVVGVLHHAEGEARAL